MNPPRNPLRIQPSLARMPACVPARTLALLVALSLLPFGAALAQPAPGRAASATATSALSGAEQSCRAADHNHDGYISLEEYHRDIARSWAALGPDATGHVQLEDLAAVPGLRRSVLERLRRADTDGDGRLSFKEVVTARMAQFDAADLDRDDRLSMKECIDHERKLAAALRQERAGKAR
ncbi:MAG: hypothetical protein ACKO5J_13825 [Rubrivivax sp.]